MLVSGAAGNFPALANDLSPNGFKAVVDIDLLGTFHVMKAAYPHMRKPGGSLINISAPQAFLPMAWQVHVCAAKAGVDMVTRCLAIEWGPEGLRVNGVVPGPIDGTEGMARLAPSEEAREAIKRNVPMRRWGTPEDVARACLYLGSEAAAYVNGTIITADGGWALTGARMRDALAALTRRGPVTASGRAPPRPRPAPRPSARRPGRTPSSRTARATSGSPSGTPPPRRPPAGAARRSPPS